MKWHLPTIVWPRHSGILYLSPVTEHSGIELVPVIPVPDWNILFSKVLDWPDAGQSGFNKNRHPAHPHFKWCKGYTLHVRTADGGQEPVLRIRYWVPFWPLDPGWEKVSIRIRDEQPGSYFIELKNHFFWVKILKFFDEDLGWRQFGSGMEKSRIRDKHPGSATLTGIHPARPYLW